MRNDLRAQGIRAELRRRGLSRSRAERAAQELAEHWEDLEREALGRGLSPAEAESFASDSLGDWDQLAAAFHSARESGSLPSRHPLIVFFFCPVLLFTALFGSVLALGAFMGYLAGWWGGGNSLNDHELSLLMIAVRAAHAGTLLVTQAAFCWLACRYGNRLRCAAYSAVGLSLYGLIHQVTFQPPNIAGRGSLTWSYGFTTDVWSGIAPLACLVIFSWLVSKQISRSANC